MVIVYANDDVNDVAAPVDHMFVQTDVTST